jgi:hypothetical protein
MKSTIALSISAFFLAGLLAMPAATAQMSTLAGLFENAPVTSLHVYAYRGAQIPADHPFVGQAIPSNFHNLFQGEFRPMLEGGAEVYATQRFQSGSIDYYLVRVVAGSGEGLMNALYLFRGDAQGMHAVSMLSLASCARRICAQQDAWLENLPGGAGLGLLIKSQRVSDSGELLSQMSQWMVQEPNGAFRAATPDEIAALPQESGYVLRDLP